MNTLLITPHLRTSFHAIGAEVRAVPLIPQPATRFGWRPATPPGPRINVRDDAFELVLPPLARAAVLDCRKPDRHLVLSLQGHGEAPQRFLCGFDERHWFAAAVKGHTVTSAKESLLPSAVRKAVLTAGIRHAERFHRRNRAFIRQGEWFFVADDHVAIGRLTIHQREPLIRPGGGKPHVVDELVRGAGEMVWHHAKLAPNGVNDAVFEQLTRASPKTPGWSRRMLVRNGAVFARGAVRHPDHATIWLSGWHRVYINSEVRPASLGFLD